MAGDRKSKGERKTKTGEAAAEAPAAAPAAEAPAAAPATAVPAPKKSHKHESHGYSATSPLLAEQAKESPRTGAANTVSSITPKAENAKAAKAPKDPNASPEGQRPSEPPKKKKMDPKDAAHQAFLERGKKLRMTQAQEAQAAQSAHILEQGHVAGPPPGVMPGMQQMAIPTGSEVVKTKGRLGNICVLALVFMIGGYLLSQLMSVDAFVEWLYHYDNVCADGVFVPGPPASPLNTLIWMFILTWIFVGCAIAADSFLAAIETITSHEAMQMVKLPNGTSKQVQVTVWNSTIANLTLMALGSSAPEIMLSCVEIGTSERYYVGSLGPSTIVGSAAFNMLVITAVCIMAVPSGQGRAIKDEAVFYITAYFSLFAFLWLIVILLINTPNIVDPWEGIVTFACFPLIVLCTYLADINACGWCGREYESSAMSTVIDIKKDGKPVSRDDVTRILALDSVKQIQERAPEDTINAVVSLLQPPQSKAHYRREATRKAHGGKPKETADHVKLKEQLLIENGKASDADASSLLAKVAFKVAGIAVHESEKWATLEVERTGNLTMTATVHYHTVETGNATADKDYVSTQGVLTFKAFEETASIKVRILQDEEVEEDETFQVQLTKPGKGCKLGAQTFIEVTIIDDDGPGELFWAYPEMTALEGDKHCQLTVERTRGVAGTVGCQWLTEQRSAINGRDFVGATGDVVFPPGVSRQIVTIDLLDTGRYDGSVNFAVHLLKPWGNCNLVAEASSHEIKETVMASVTIASNHQRAKEVDDMVKKLELSVDAVAIGHNSYESQFREAVHWEGGGIVQVVMWLVALPWKLVIAIIPPPSFCSGLLAFPLGFIAIGLLTTLIGDVANQMGCCMGLHAEITAITFVAIGTSLPDTFASKTAAETEPHADAAIVNITGSNSVNVFLGLGLPWMLASIYWAYYSTAEDEAAWHDKYRGESWYKSGMDVGFAVPSGDLGFSIITYTILGIGAFILLVLRRRLTGFELGGPWFLKWVSALVLVGMWVLYIGLSALSAYGLFAVKSRHPWINAMREHVGH